MLCSAAVIIMLGYLPTKKLDRGRVITSVKEHHCSVLGLKSITLDTLSDDPMRAKKMIDQALQKQKKKLEKTEEENASNSSILKRTTRKSESEELAEADAQKVLEEKMKKINDAHQYLINKYAPKDHPKMAQVVEDVFEFKLDEEAKMLSAAFVGSDMKGLLEKTSTGGRFSFESTASTVSSVSSMVKKKRGSQKKSKRSTASSETSNETTFVLPDQHKRTSHIDKLSDDVFY